MLKTMDLVIHRDLRKLYLMQIHFKITMASDNHNHHQMKKFPRIHCTGVRLIFRISQSKFNTHPSIPLPRKNSSLHNRSFTTKPLSSTYIKPYKIGLAWNKLACVHCPPASQRKVLDRIRCSELHHHHTCAKWAREWEMNITGRGEGGNHLNDGK